MLVCYVLVKSYSMIAFSWIDFYIGVAIKLAGGFSFYSNLLKLCFVVLGCSISDKIALLYSDGAGPILL